ncbi:hypothetical protein BKA56DRAFT_120332 [Ilyonectria sp. MPI-CAGE-AT-0026]|nr:hypothetical protein BKA56DRAFT_120332 [Ilyonectria sp. MPI-CAGE-AT-0026]
MPQELGRFTIKQRETQHVFTDPVNEGKSTGKTRSSDAAEGNEEGSVGFFQAVETCRSLKKRGGAGSGSTLLHWAAEVNRRWVLV